MYARYRTRSRFYKRPEKILKAYNVSPNTLRWPRVKSGLLHGVYHDQKVDLRDREQLEMLESIRHPKERDFYQDHTYHNQWVTRELQAHQRSQLNSRYKYFAPNYVISPWVWYPGDTVEVMSGEGAGQRGVITAVIQYKNEILVQNINVQDITIPASETRPEQVIQREHPISVTRVRHVDPSTNKPCHLELVSVRDKVSGVVEEKRISLESGVLLPIPTPEEAIDVGDPLKDTPLQDADEPTYDAAREMPLLVQRRLHAMENYFVRTLKESHEFHAELRRRNAEDMLAFQEAVVRRGAQLLAEQASTPLQQMRSSSGATPAATIVSDSSETAPRIAEEDSAAPRADAAVAAQSSWWYDMLSPHIQSLGDEAEAQRAEAQQAAAAAAEGAQVGNLGPHAEAELDEEGYAEDDEVQRGEELGTATN